MQHCVTRQAARKQTHILRAAAWHGSALRVVATIALIAATCVTGAQDYPTRPIRMIAPFTAGGGADAYARILAKKLSEVVQQQVIVDNRGGANGIIGTEIVARAAPNGYTIVFVTSAFAVNPAVRRTLPFDSVKDFAPISLFTEIPFFLVTHPSFPPQSVPELLALARPKPGQINYAASTAGSALHFAAEMMKVYAKVDIAYVSYKGAAEATTAALAGEVPITFQGPAVMPHVKAGRLRALAVTSAKRSPAWPDVPTIQEGGVPKYEYTTWHGLLAPGKTPTPVVARLHQAVVQAVRDQSLAKALIADGAELHGSTPEQFRDFLAREMAKYRELVRAMGGLTVD